MGAEYETKQASQRHRISLSTCDSSPSFNVMLFRLNFANVAAFQKLIFIVTNETKYTHVSTRHSTSLCSTKNTAENSTRKKRRTSSSTSSSAKRRVKKFLLSEHVDTTTPKKIRTYVSSKYDMMELPFSPSILSISFSFYLIRRGKKWYFLFPTKTFHHKHSSENFNIVFTPYLHPNTISQ